MAIFLKRNGSWQKIEEPYIKRNGNWILPEEGYIKENGQWKLIFEQFEFEVETVSASEQINEATFTGQLTAFEDFQESSFFQTKLTDATTSPGIAVDGERQKVAVGGGDDTVYVYDRDFDLELTLSNPSDRVLDCSYNTNTGRIAAASADNNVYVYDSDGNLEQALTDPTDEVNAVEFNENTGELAAGSKDTDVYVYDSNLSLTDTVTQPSNAVKSLDWRESDNYLFVAADPGEVTVFDNTLSVTTSLSDATGDTRVAVGDNDRVAVLDSDQVWIYTNNFSVTDQLAEFDETAPGDLGDLAWDDTGQVAHASRDNNLYIYDSSYQNIATLDDSNRRFVNVDWGTNEVIAAGADEGGQGDAFIFSSGVAVFFEWGQQGSGLPNRSRAGGRTALGQFSVDVDGLQPLTSYEVRAGGETSEGREAFGDTIIFSTSDNILQVDTLQPANVFTTTADLRGEITAFAGFNQDADVLFEWGEQSSGPVNTLNVGTQSGTGFFEEEVTGLSDGETYVYRAVAQAGNETETGPEVTFSTTAIQLNVDTLGATSVQSQTATLNGDLTTFNGFTQNATIEFEWGEQGSGFPNTTTADQSPLGSTDQFSTTVDVDPAITYEYRATAAAEGATDAGGFITFTTQDTTLQVQTDPATSVTFDAATLNGDLTAFGGFQQNTDADVEFEWGEAGTGLQSIADAGTLSSTGTFDAQISGLNNDTQYEYRAVAEAGTKTRTGSTVQFTTDDVQISVDTLAVDQIQKTSAQLNGELTQLAGTNSTTVSFAWGQTGQGTPNTTSGQTFNSTGTFNETISGLQQSTDYEFKAQAGSEEGSLQQFTTSEFVIQIDTDAWSFNGGDDTTFGESLSVNVSVANTGGFDYSYSVRELVNGNDQGTVASASNVSNQSFTANWNVGDSPSVSDETELDQGDTISYEVKVTDTNGNIDTTQSPDLSYQEAPAISVPSSKSFFAQQGSQQTRSADISEVSGFEDLTISNASITGTDSGDFTFSNLPSTVTAGTTEQVDVTYQPSTVDTDDATLEIDHDGQNTGTPVTVSLEGNAQQVPLIDVTPDSKDFGSVPIGDTPTQNFTVSESGGDSDLTINSTSLSGDAEFNITQDIPGGTMISTNGSDTITVEYVPQTSGVTSNGTLTINSDADNNGSVDVSLTGTAAAVPAINLDPDGAQDLGTISADQTTSETFTINETSGQQQLTTSVGLSGSPSDWSIQNAPSSVPAGGSASFDVVFDSSTSGTSSVTLEVQHDGTNTSSPVTRDLTGEATQESTIDVTPNDGTTLSFGTIIEDETTTQTVTISETGGSNSFSVSNFSITGNAFSITSTTPSTIQPVSSETVDIEFDPGTDGNFNETFSFEHTAAAGDTDQSVTISLEATADPVSTISTSPSDGGTLTLSATSGNIDTGTISVSEVGGGESFDVTSWSLTDNSSGGNEFNVTSDPGSNFTVGAVSSESFTIEYAPSDSTNDSGSFEINHNAVDGPGSPITINISGASQAPATFDIDTTSLSFANSLVSNSGDSDTEIANISETGGENGFNITSQSVTSNSNDFTITNSASSSVSPGPGNSTSITVKFDPQGSVTSGTEESRTGNVEIQHDAPEGNSSPVNVSLSGTALKRATASISPTSMDFGNVAVGDSSSQTFTVSETSTNESFDVPSQGVFEFTASHYSFSNFQAQTISAGGSSGGTITFSPGSTGTKQNTFQVSHDATNGSNPLEISLTGEAVQEVTASISPQSVDFGTLASSDSTQSEQFTVSETSGNGSFSITNRTITGSDPSPFGNQGVNVGDTISDGNPQSGDVLFNPPSSSGSFSATFELSHDAPAGNNPLTIDLSATVEIPSEICLSTDSLTFPATTAGNTSAEQSFTVSETGGDNGISFGATGEDVATGGFTGSFNVTDGLASSISAGTSDTVSIEFTPQGDGTETATFRLDNNDADQACSGNPPSDPGSASVSLSGEGLAQANVIGTNPPGGSTLSFPDTAQDQESRLSVTLEETGGDNGASFSIFLSGDTGQFKTENFNLDQFSQGTVNAGGTNTGDIVFQPGSTDTGDFTATVEFNWNGNSSSASGTVSYTAAGTALGSPSLSVTPDPLDFGDVDIANSSQKSLTFKETTGNDEITVDDFAPDINDPFGVAYQNDTSFTLSAGGTRTVEIDFDPDTINSFSETYDARFTSPSLSSARNTTLLTLVGNGVDPSAPSISVTESTTNFDPVEVDGSTNVEGALVINETSGNEDLTINSVTLNEGLRFDDGTNAFSITNTIPSTLGAGQSADVDIQFAPTGDGVQTARVDIDTNATNNSVVEVNISGDVIVSFESINWSFTSGEEFAGGQGVSVSGGFRGIGAQATNNYDFRIEEKITLGQNAGLSADIVNQTGLSPDTDGTADFNNSWNVGDAVGANNFGDGNTIEYTVEVKHDGFTKTRSRSITVSEGQPFDLTIQGQSWNTSPRQFNNGDQVVTGEVTGIRANTNDVYYVVQDSDRSFGSGLGVVASGSFNFNKSDDTQSFTINADSDGIATQYNLHISETSASGAQDTVTSPDVYTEPLVVLNSNVGYSIDVSSTDVNFIASWSGGEADYTIQINNLTQGTTPLPESVVSTSDSDRSGSDSDVTISDTNSQDGDTVEFIVADNGQQGQGFQDTATTTVGTFDSGGTDTTDTDSTDQTPTLESEDIESQEYDPDDEQQSE